MANNLDPREWLSDNVVENISFALRDNVTNKDKDRQTYFLYDGTLITIERNNRMSIGTSFINDLSNPKNIKVKGRCTITLEYIGSNGDTLLHDFEVNGIADLEKQWNSFKKENNIEQETIGTLEKIYFTSKQRELIGKLERATNDLLNLLQDTDVKMDDINVKEMKMMDRHTLINFVITNVAKNLVQFGIAKRVHLPYAIRGIDMDEAVEIREYIDSNTFMEE